MAKGDKDWRPAGRRLVVVDIENVAGGACLTTKMAAVARRRIERRVGFRPDDQIVVGTCHAGLLAVALTWPAARRVVRSGRDGADLALIEVLKEGVVGRFDEVLIASGDAVFVRPAAKLREQGLTVTVVSWRSNLSRRLREAADRVIPIDFPRPGLQRRSEWKAVG
jgi:hypothetical protein